MGEDRKRCYPRNLAGASDLQTGLLIAGKGSSGRGRARAFQKEKAGLAEKESASSVTPSYGVDVSRASGCWRPASGRLRTRHRLQIQGCGCVPW